LKQLLPSPFLPLFSAYLSDISGTIPPVLPVTVVNMVFSVKSALGVAVLALSPVVLAAAIPEPGSIWVRQDFGSCRNQSCAVATVSGSTGSSVYDFSSYPVGDTQDGNCCIVRYFPAAKDALYKARPGLQQYCASHGGDAPLDKNPPGITTVTVVNPKSKRATCKANILIYSKGTLEPGDLGITLGPQIKAGLDAKLWEVRGVQYDNSFANDYCLGLPGGINVRQALAKAVSDCPNARIHMSGYSQGALVTRNVRIRSTSRLRRACAYPQILTIRSITGPRPCRRLGRRQGRRKSRSLLSLHLRVQN
jgi:hypothetical protein